MCPYLNVSEECHQCTDCPQASSIKGHFVILVRTMTRSAFLVRICEVSENQCSEENQIVHKDIDVLEGEPPPDCLGSVLRASLTVQSLNCPEILHQERDDPEHRQQIIPGRLLLINQRQEDDDGEQCL